jgi:hypothetical protein
MTGFDYRMVENVRRNIIKIDGRYVKQNELPPFYPAFVDLFQV